MAAILSRPQVKAWAQITTRRKVPKHLKPWASYQIRKIACAHAPGMLSQPPQVSDPDMHHGTCVTHMPWCMPGISSFFWSQWRGKTFPAFPAHAQPAIYISGKRHMASTLAAAVGGKVCLWVSNDKVKGTIKSLIRFWIHAPAHATFIHTCHLPGNTLLPVYGDMFSFVFHNHICFGCC